MQIEASPRLPRPGRPRPGGADANSPARWSAALLVLVLPAVVRAGATQAEGRRATIGPFLGRRLPATAPAPSGGWAVVPAFPRLTFEDPTFLVHPPRGDALYVGSRQGLIWTFADDPNAATRATFLDLRGRCQGWDDGGLLAMAFHPRFGRPGSPERGYVYVWYSYTPNPVPGPGRPPTTRATRNRLARFTVPDGSEAADPDSEFVLIDQLDENLWHNGGGMFFHPEDGFLYLALGDEGGDYGNAQRIDKDLFAGVIRIDVDRRGGAVSHPIRKQPATGTTAGYFIPDDNPWVGVPGALEEFWCIGLRSPHRMTYDPVGRRIWLGDVGESSREEVDLIERGGNYQWRFKEGTLAGPDGKPGKVLGVETPPIYEYGHDQGTAVIGGYVYRGAEHAAALGGKYVFGDNSGRVWALTRDGAGPPRVEALCDLPRAPSRAYGSGLSSFGVGRDGELYLCQLGDEGRIFKLARTGPADAALPRLLSQTGAFRDLRTLEPAPGLVPYEVNAPLWSDGAAKRRWIAVPDDGRIGYAPAGAWSFPDGTVFVKHFELATDGRRPDARRRLETRFLVRSAGGGAYGLTYRWRPDGSDAELIDEAEREEIRVEDGRGGRAQVWQYPGRRQCLMCHTAAAGLVLGVNARQLNRAGAGPAGNQLLAWGRLGLLDPAPGAAEVARLPRLVALDDRGASLESRVRSYLDANCAHCHRPGGVRARLDARADAPPGEAGLIDAAIANPLGVADARAVAAGDPARSIALRRMASTDPAIRMPPLGSGVVDERASDAMRAWIAGLPAPPRVRLARPATHAVVGSGADLAMEAAVAAGERPVRAVEFYLGGTRLGRVAAPPFALTWRAAEVGSFALTARALDDRGVAATSDGVMVTVVPAGSGQVELGDLPWVAASSGWGPIEVNRSNGETAAGDGRTITLDGVAYPRGLGVHAPSEVTYRLGGAYAAFLASVGVDDEVGTGGSVRFEVWADGAKLYDSGVQTGGSPTRDVRVDVTGKAMLRLVVTDGGDGNGLDHADWAGARLLPAGAGGATRGDGKPRGAR